MLKYLIALFIAAAGVSANASDFVCNTLDVRIVPMAAPVLDDVPFGHLQEDRPNLLGNTSMRVIGRVNIDNGVCVLDVGYADPRITIATELKASKCAYEHVMTHEMTHYFIYANAAATLKARIMARFKPGMLWQGTAESLYEVVSQEVIDPVKLQNEALDSPTEYRRNAYACGGIIKQLIKAN